MGKTLKKYLLFDLDTTALKEEFGPKRYTVAYSMIRQFLENCGFEHKQGSGYLSTEPISLNQTIAIYQAMTEEMPWLDSCSKTMDVGNVRGFYNLKTLSQNLVADNAVDNSQLELADFDRVFPAVGISHDESMSRRYLMFDLVDKIDDLQGRIRPKADDVSIENFIYLNQIKADVPEPDQFGHAEENDHIFGLISKFAEGQDTAFVVQKVNFSGTKQIGEPEYELLPLGPTSGEDLADFTEWFMDDFKSGIDFGCDENREHLAMLAHTGFYREGEYVDQLLTFHQLDFSNAHAVTEKFSFEGRPESNEFIGDLDQLFHDPNSLVSSSDIIDIIENEPVGGVSNGGKPCREHTRLSDKAETAKSACSKIAESEQRERGIEKPIQIEAK